MLGYVSAGLELASQIQAGELPAPRQIYIAAATGGTALGLAMGLALSGSFPVPEIFAVETVSVGWQRARVFLPTPQRALMRLRSLSPEAKKRLPARVELLNVRFLRGFDGNAEARVRSAQAEAAALGLTLDVHYSARAWAALPKDKSGVLFWQTHGRVSSELLQASRSSGVALPPAVEAAARRGLAT